jgi:hypothetical protein
MSRPATGCAVSPFPPAELGHRAHQILLGEVRPQGIEEDELGICRLPQEKVGNALLARSADNQVGIGNSRRRQPPREAFFGDVLRRQLASGDFFGGAPRGQGDVGAAPIVQRHREVQPVIVARQRFPFVDQADDLPGEGAAAADHAEANIMLMDVGDLAAQIARKQPHQIADFGFGPLPIFR